MKVYMFEWVGGIKNLPSWWENNKVADITLEQIKELYDTGNNVMIRHWSIEKEPMMMMAVDNGIFNQR